MHERLQFHNLRDAYYVDLETLSSRHKSLVDHARSKILYNELAPIFDLAISRNNFRETDFLNNVINLHKPKAKYLLDIGCGCGRHAELLSRRFKYSVTGLDLSEELIKSARFRCPGGKFLKMDMRRIDLKCAFDVAICMWSTFNYLSSPSELKQFFKGVSKSLKETGLLILDLKNHKEGSLRCHFRQNEDERYSVKLWIFKRLIKDVAEAVYIYLLEDLQTGERKTLLDQELNMKYSLGEVEAKAKPEFQLIKTYGDYDLISSFNPKESDRLIIILKKQD